jgi:hypothetical protein
MRGQAAWGLESSHHAAPSMRAPVTPTHLLGSAKEPGELRGCVGDSRICAGAEAGNAATLAGDAGYLAKPHGMLRGSDAGGNGRRYGEERGALKRIHQEDSCNPWVASVVDATQVWPRYEYTCRVRCRLFVRLAPARR